MNHPRIWVLKAALVLAGVALALSAAVIFNLTRLNARLYEQSRPSSDHELSAKTDESALLTLRREALTRVMLYESLIQKDMLLDGMVVHRNPDGTVGGQCDSLLFSNLRFFALRSMGLKDASDDAWSAILKSRDGGLWLRHPKCPKSLSRDMIMGVLMGLSADPDGGTQVFASMLAEIDRQQGFVGDGPFYVSWLSPGIAGLLRAEAERRHIPYEQWPWILKQSFSSIEYDAMFLGEGYVSHLAALGLDLELRFAEKSHTFNPRSLLGQAERLVKGWGAGSTRIDAQRRQWIASHLRSINRSNLYYEWIEQRAFGTLTIASERELLERLLAMEQFPPSRLPSDCERDADYLWQRREADAQPTPGKCGYRWNGVDFLWMAAALGVRVDQEQSNPDVPAGAMELSH